MSFQQVKELRKTGKIDEALTMALNDYSQNAEDIWNKRSLAWVYYDFLKKYQKEKQTKLFLETFDKLLEIKLSEDEKMLFDSCAWLIGKLLFSISNKQEFDYSIIIKLFEKAQQCHFTKPSEAYSFLFKGFLKFKQVKNFIQFADWWDFKNFREDDYKAEVVNEIKVISVAEQAHIAYSKSLLNSFNFENKETQKDKIRQFLPILDKIIEEHPNYTYNQYYKAKLLIALGEGNNILSDFLPFAQKKRNDFWIWDVLSDAVAEREQKISCLCRALLCRSPEEFLVNIRLKLARLLIQQELYNEAKTEIAEIAKVRTSNKWKLPSDFNIWYNENWFKEAKPNSNNKKLYSSFKQLAESILYSDKPEIPTSIYHINIEKGIIHYVVNKFEHGYFHNNNMIDSPEIGDVLLIRFGGRNNMGKSAIISVNKTNKEIEIESQKYFEGNITIKDSKSFGFVNDIYVEPNLIQKYKIENNQFISGQAILSFNKKNDSWNFKVYKIALEQIDNDIQ